jgi:two-component system KDP operon response regulator KdpE
MNTQTIVIIEDEEPIRKFLRISLEARGYRVHESRSGETGLNLCAEKNPDLVILDLGLPDMDGLRIIERLRGWTDTPVLVLSVRADERQKVLALDAGANDYMTKPFGISELLARVRALLRKPVQAGDTSPVRSFGGLRVDLNERRLWVDGREVRLTRKEFELLGLLCARPDHLFTHQQILDAVWGRERGAETQNLRVLVAALREKLDDDPATPRYILTEPGVGYRFIVPPA